ncbi:hypothetical protein ACFU53_36780 [Streptomyces sp. NPDC057474]|uniref:hypothetical protein n=1 Tax=Streptomyces sp. NPDC057474 TaxID=3346144 RepID=UPI00367A08B1
MREASQNSQQAKPDQHVVSRVLLDQFAEPVNSKGERLVSSLNRAYIHAKPTKRGPAGCGKFRHFVRYASDSTEAAWMATETLLREALDAADKGHVLRPEAALRHGPRRDRAAPGAEHPALIVSDETWRDRHAAHIDHLATTE